MSPKTKGNILHKKIFTPAEASKTLPLVRKIVDDLLKCGRTLIENHNENEHSLIVQIKKNELIELMEELTSIGCHFKDWNFEVGLVDFPSIINDEEVFLCWKSDEPGLLYYHKANEGFSNRKLIPKEYFQLSYA